MRSPTRRRAAALLALALAGAGLGLTPSPVVAAECPDQLRTCVVVSVVETVDGTTRTVKSYTVKPDDLQTWSAEDLALNDRQYKVRKNPKSKGGTIQEGVAEGVRVSINALLKHVDPGLADSATYLETPNTAGIPAVLSDADLVAPDSANYPFFEKLQPAVYLTDGGRIGYIRPLRDKDEDTNASDYFQVSGRLDLTIHTTGRLLAPTVASSAGNELELKKKTTFSVTYDQEPRTGLKSITWDFGDGSVKNTTREKPSKSYAKKGTYPVVVTVRTNDGSYGRSPANEIKVAKPPKAPSSGTGGGSGSGGSGGTSFPPLYDPPSFSTPDFSSPDFDSPDFDQPPLEPDDLDSVPVDDGLEPVEGFVLAGAEIVPGGTPESIPGTENSTAPAPATQATTRTRVATWVLAGLAVALLIGMGAATETRWFRNQLRHLRRRA